MLVKIISDLLLLFKYVFKISPNQDLGLNVDIRPSSVRLLFKTVKETTATTGNTDGSALAWWQDRLLS